MILQKSIRKKYQLYFIIFVIFPLFLGNAIILYYISDKIEELIYDKYKSEVVNIKDNYINILLDISNNFLLSFRDGSVLLDKGISIIGALPWDVRISYIDIAGNIFTYPEVRKNSNEYISNKIWEKVDLDNMNIVWESPYLSYFDPVVVTTGSRVLYDKEKILGIISVDIPTKYFIANFKNEALNHDLKLLIIDNNKKPILLNRKKTDPIEYFNLVSWEDIIESNNYRKTMNINNKKFYAIISEIDILNYHLVNLLPKEVLNKEIFPILLGAIIFLLFFSVFVLVGIFLISKKILTNIFNINNHLMSIENGNLNTKWYITSKDEFFDINCYINNMAKSLTETITELKNTIKKNKKLIDLRTTLLHVVSHNSASPVTLLLNNTQLLMLENSKETIYKEMFYASESIKSLLDNLLVYLKIDEGIILRNEKVCLSDVTKYICCGYEIRLSSKSLELVLNLNYETLVAGENTVIRVILENLIDNAIKYSFHNGVIEINSYIHNNWGVWEIQDNGPGFKDSEIDNMFNIFSTLSAKPTAGEKSTGLGLHIVKKLLVLLNGEIKLLKCNKGSKFQLLFPLVNK